MIDKINNVKAVPLVNKGTTYINMHTSGGHSYFLTEEGKVFKLMEMSCEGDRPKVSIDKTNITIAQAMLESFVGTRQEWVLSDDGRPENVNIGNRNDNRLSNLQYLYRLDNVKKGGKK